MNDRTRQTLRQLVGDQLTRDWTAFAAAHPALAAALDRITLVDAAVESLAADPAFVEAIANLGHDAARLREVEWVLERVARVARLTLPL